VTPLELSVQPGPEGIRLRVAGEVDSSNVDRLRAALSTEPAEGAPIVIDLAGVRYIDSAGMAALFARAASTRLEIVCPEGCVARSLIEVTRLSDVAVIRGT
jgi:anti-anti-sigma factor